ncbi:MAG: BspA family leucine-rich repeat surface protein [Flavobacteriaceae bacterium]|nr:BspA family leucine-rich repeat surface protein [Flavobacteriaceae bacterium]
MAQAFITTWKTDRPGSSNDTSITIPTTGTGYMYDVDWDNDGTFDEIGLTGNVTHDFGTAGTYTIRIRGTFPRIYFKNEFDKDKIVSVDQWGNQQWTSMENAFYGCSNLNGSASDNPNLSMVTDMTAMFRGATLFNQDIGDWNTENVTNMNEMFREAIAFDQAIGNWNTENVTTMFFMFGDARSFNQEIGNWDTGKVTGMKSMFLNAESFNKDISDWDTGKVTVMGFMFHNAIIFNQSIDNWNTESVTDMFRMFDNATSFDQDIGSWNVANLTNATDMFEGVTLSTTNYDALLTGWNAQTLQPNVPFSGGNSKYCAGETAKNNMMNSDGWTITDGGLACATLNTDDFVTTWKTDNPGTSNSTSITIPTFPSATYNYDVDWDNDGTFDEIGLTGNVTHNFGIAGTYTIRIRGTFPRIYFNDEFDKDKIVSVDQWGNQQWTSMGSAFHGCSNLNGPISDSPDLSLVEDMSGMFSSAISFNQAIGNWNTENVTNMSQMFWNAESFNQEIGSWNTKNVTDMSAMFLETIAFNQDIGNWDTGKVTDMSNMFRNTDFFNQDIGDWDTANVTDMSAMFWDAKLFDQDIGRWNIANVTNLNSMLRLVPFNQDISNWDTGKVTNMSSMFADAWAFNQDISNWDTKNVTSMFRMFTNTPFFNQDIGGWDTKNVISMDLMFWKATSFNQDIGGWDTGKVKFMESMFGEATSFNQDISSWNTENVTIMRSMFREATAFNQDINSWNVANLTNAAGMFTGVTLSTNNYDALLVGWNAQTLQPNVTFSGGNSKYCTTGEVAKNNMINTDGWTITDGGLDVGFDCSLPNCTTVSNPSDGAINVPVTSDLTWTAVSNADGYRITIGTSSGGTDIENNTDLSNVTSYTPPTNWTENTSYFVTVIAYNTQGDAMNCSETSFSTIGFSIGINIPAFFTPNGDNTNDFWEVTDNLETIKQIYIFDRFGKVLKKLLPTQSWDGNYRGKPMNETGYWYVIELISGEQLSGHFSLIRR